VRHSTAGHAGRDSGALDESEPFQTYFDVPVAGGALSVARAGPPLEAGGPVVLALHGMTSCHMAYRTVARLLRSQTPVTLLAPDLRGRGRSAELPEPYGMEVHIADLLAVLDNAGAERVIVVGHSMGCNIAARLAVEHPERVEAVVLLDSGLPLRPEDMDLDGPEGELYGLLDRLVAIFDSVEEYETYWRNHPALKSVWDDDIEAFMRLDYVVDEDGVRCIVNIEPVVADLEDLAFDGVTGDALTEVRIPVRLMRAERGLLDDDPVIPLAQLEEFLPRNPHVSVEMVPDVNHYTILMGGGHGPRRVAAILAELAAGS
jgi:pimeloyl-ACP methyl ester carboxylesterase